MTEAQSTAPRHGRTRLSHPRAPRVWVLHSYRAGENRQIRGLAERLGLPWVGKQLCYRPSAGTVGMLRRVSLAGIDPARSDPLTPPWPDLLISAGLRNEPVARWVRTQSGGRTHIVFLGRTWVSPDELDLLITTPQYRLDHHPRVMHNLLTQHDVTPYRLSEAREIWEPRFAHLARPRLGALVGGRSGPYAFGPQTAMRLARTLDDLRARAGGSVVVTTSARTPGWVGEILERDLRGPRLVHRWRPGDAENPYLGILACCDELVVSGDSVAMLSEAAATGSPVRIFPLHDRGPEDRDVQASLYRLLMRWGPERASRDVALFHQAYVAAGCGSLLHPSQPAVSGVVAGGDKAADEARRTVERVLSLLDDRGRRAPPLRAPRRYPPEPAARGSAR